MPEASWVELRVHGVSGTPPGSMLDRPYVLQVGGDDESRYFRSVDAAGRELPGHDGQILEAYHWGRLTSGSKVKALWLVLLPFGMVNAAQFMLPAVKQGWLPALVHSTCGALLRLLALLLTSMFAFAGGLVLIDLLAWRWIPGAWDLPDWVDPTSLLRAAIVLSALVVAVLAFLGRGYGDDEVGPVDRHGAGQQAPSPLADPAFYRGNSHTPALRNLHLAGGFLVVAAMGTWVTHPFAWETDSLGLWFTLGAWGVALAAVTLLGTPAAHPSLVLGPVLSRVRRGWHHVAFAVSWLVLACSVLALARAVVRTPSYTPDEWARRRDRPVELDFIANWLVLIGIVVLVLLLLAAVGLVVVQWSTRPPKGTPARAYKPYAGGTAAGLFATIATFVGVGMAAAVTTGIASVLRVGREVPGSDTDLTVGTTPMLDRIAYAWGWNMVFFVAVAVAVLVWRYAVRKRVTDVVEPMYGGAEPLLTRRWMRRVRRQVHLARLKNATGALCVSFVLFGSVLAVVLFVEIAPCVTSRTIETCGHAPGWLDLLSQPKYTLDAAGAKPLWSLIGLAGAWLLIAAAGALLVAGRKAIAKEGRRRGLNVFWDVFSFWPHAAHPFAPRPYSLRCVTDLRARIRWHLAQPRLQGADRSVVVCGHSQGSLISFATLLTLSQEERDRVALVTFGSQLRVIFPRAFPAYVNYEAIRWLYDRLDGAWINLYRETDQLAGPVFSWRRPRPPGGGSWHVPDGLEAPQPDVEGELGTRRRGADWCLADPVVRDRPLQEGAVSAILGHSWYARNPDWQTCLAEVRAIAAPAPNAAPTAGAQPSPSAPADSVSAADQPARRGRVRAGRRGAGG